MFLTPTPHHIRFVAAPPEGGESTGGTGQPPASAGKGLPLFRKSEKLPLQLLIS